MAARAINPRQPAIREFLPVIITGFVFPWVSNAKTFLKAA